MPEDDKIIHFKSAKKRTALRNKEAKAAQNRVKYGRTKAQKHLEGQSKMARQKKMDGHKITTNTEDRD